MGKNHPIFMHRCHYRGHKNYTAIIMAKRGTFYIGTSNIVLPVTKKDFPADYQSASRLHYYSSLFNSLEVNSTFYKLPRPDTFVKWANEVSDNFRFTIKLWREITHAPKLAYHANTIGRFMQAATGIGNKKGCLLVQFPASITEAYHDAVEAILERIAERNIAPCWQVCVEFRHTSWYEAADTLQLLGRYRASLTGHDMPKSHTLPRTHTRTINLRFHGQAGDYRGSYTTEALNDYANHIHTWINQGKDVYAYFNNTLGEAFNNARTLQAEVNSILHQSSTNSTSTVVH